jgi:hypothetical protein
MVVFLALGCSCRFPGIFGADMDDARDYSWRHCFTAWLYLAANPSHMRVNMDGLACSLHHPTTCSHQMRGQGLLPGVVLSCHCSRWWRLSGGCEALELGYLVES